MNENEECITYGQYVRINIEPKKSIKEIHKKESIYFEIPININKVLCNENMGLQKSTGKGSLSFQIKIKLVEPEYEILTSNKLEILL